MGAASYLEDIIDRRGGGFSDRDKNSLPPGMFLVAPPKESGWIRLIHSDGVPMADRFVPVVNEVIFAEVERENSGLDWEVEIESQERQVPPVSEQSEGTLSLKFSAPGLFHLRLICGAYCKSYEVEVLSQPEIDSLPEVRDAYHRLIKNPDSWTEDTIHTFLDGINKRDSAGTIPRSFSDGLFEYHLALYLADRNVKRSHECFEEAYRRLRPFAGISAIAQFVVDYILFRKNTFKGHGQDPQGTRFGGLRQFFRLEYDEWMEARNDSEARPKHGHVSVLLLPTDQLCLRIIHATKATDKGSVQPLLRELLEAPETSDDAERARVTLVLARGYRFLGKRHDAQKQYACLRQISEEPLWDDEAKQFLG